MERSSHNHSIGILAKAGLISKGVVYVLLGALALMTALEIGNRSGGQTDQSSVLKVIEDWPAGQWLLGLLAAGLVCYSVWRWIQAFYPSTEKDQSLVKRIRYFFSGLVYLSLAFTAVKLILDQAGKNGDNNEHWAAEIMSRPLGQWLLGLIALVIAGIGVYQIWYGLSEKYRKHVENLRLNSGYDAVLLQSGKLGYIARGMVWLIIGFLFFRAALYANASEAGDTGGALQFIQSSSLGQVALALVAIGLIAYGTFNFVRARFDKFA
ncbi:MAG TPA: DUF1206 domain-containing protein [Flavisolibacter sp.]|nr:DUF1206 domain-containing protein [Flavisolibacter sp.]